MVKVNRFLILSVLIHCILGILLFFEFKEKTVPRQSIQIEIQVMDSKPTQKSVFAQRAKIQKSDGLRKNGRSIGQKSILEKFSPEPGAYRTQSDLGTLRADNPQAPWGEGGTDFGRIREYSLMSRVYEQVDGVLHYPQILARHKIQGTVQARLVLNAKGECDWKQTQIHGGHSYLRVYVLDVLKKTCRQKYFENLAGRISTNIDMSFAFTISEHDDDELIKRENIVLGNVLMFRRNSQQSVAQWNLGPLTGVFPLPFVNLDFVWLKENWETYVEGLDKFRSFKEERGT